MTNKKRFLKIISVFLAYTILYQSIFSYSAFALTEGPSSPEFSSFSPVSMTDMVDPFTGSFNYNIPVIEIPGPQGGGYAMALNYSHNNGMESEASWVGQGWTLSPGFINRDKRGFPDTYDGNTVTYYNKNRPSWTIQTPVKIPSNESRSFTKGSYASISVGKSASLGFSQVGIFSNYSGYMVSRNFGLTTNTVGVNLNLSGDQITLDVSISLSGIINKLKKETSNNTQAAETEKATDKNAKTDDQQLTEKEKKKKELRQLRKQNRELYGTSMKSVIAGQFDNFSFSTCFLNPYPAPADEMRAINYLKRFAPQLDNPSTWNSGTELDIVNTQIMYRSGKFRSEKKVYGYGKNSPSGKCGEMADFSVEKEDNNYSKTDKYIGIPFNNHDIYNVQVEGIGGSFRCYKEIVEADNYEGYRNKIKQKDLNIELNAGSIGAATTLGVGLGIPINISGQNGANWKGHNAQNNESENFYRFIGDKAGNIEYLTNGITDINAAHSGTIEGVESFTSPIYTLNTNNYRRTSVITEDKSTDNFHIVNSSGVTYNFGLTYNVRNETSIAIDIHPSHAQINGFDKIAERKFGLQNVNGEYDIPKNVIAQNVPENELSDLNDDSRPVWHKSILGHIANDEYPEGYLLTGITTPNYIDANNNQKLDNEDLGGWTKFAYRKHNNWYRYRMPYYGFYYEQGSISDPNDDLGSVSTGEKQVYYLGKVETKTHVAYFITNKTNKAELEKLYIQQNNKGESRTYSEDDDTFLNKIDNEVAEKYLKGSGTDRKDGNAALPLEGTVDPMSRNDYRIDEDNSTEYLEKIVLFSKNRPDKPIKTVRFSYTYESFPKIHNNIEVNNTNEDFNIIESGKLTLKKVWFEYEGLNPVKISPYQFKYNYKKASNATTEGESYLREYEQYISTEVYYDPMNLDGWGNVQQYAKARNRFGIPWIYQGRSLTKPEKSGNWKEYATEYNEGFDIAPYKLKQIILPSGGEVHIQYEEHDYDRVQDRKPMTMVSLLKNEATNSSQVAYINLEDIGIKPDETNREALADLYVDTLKQFFGEENKIYFKYLYSLIFTNKNPTLNNRTAEYIEGYTSVDASGITSDNVEGQLTIKIPFKKSKAYNGEYSGFPEDAVYHFIVNNRSGKISETNHSGVEKYMEKELDRKFINAEARTVQNVKDGKKELNGLAYEAVLRGEDPRVGITQMLTDLFNSVSSRVFNYPVNEEMSFLKLPVLFPKKGGGVRVKRVLFVDNGIETGNGGTYGTEYIYGETVKKTTPNNTEIDMPHSWGVASNEPIGIGKEHALREFQKKGKQEFFNQIFTGRDKEQHEGPLGETVLPSPSIGYKKVIAKSIYEIEDAGVHEKKSSPGYTVYQFHTAEEYPFDKVYPKRYSIGPQTEIKGKAADATNFSKSTRYIENPPAFDIFTHDLAYLTQGFRFIDVKMHGIPKKTMVCSGIYPPKNDDQYSIISSTSYNYYLPGQKIQVWDGENVEYIVPGKEMDITEAGRLVDETKLKIDIELDFGIYYTPPAAVVPDFSLAPRFSIKTNYIAKHAICKTISYPVIAKSIETEKNGVRSSQEFLVFDAATGEPLITRTKDSYDSYANSGDHNGEIYSVAVPAMWKYDFFKSADDNGSNQLNTKIANFTAYGEDLFPVDNQGNRVFNKNWILSPTNILSASVVEYTNDWDWATNEMLDGNQYKSNIISNLVNRYLLKATYSYLPDPSNLNIIDNTNKLTFEQGAFSIPSSDMFSLQSGDLFSNAPDNKEFGWIKTSEVTKYSPSGQAVEQEDAIKVKSSVLLGKQYGDMLPIMKATNASHSEIYFQDYEDYVANERSELSHSGNYAGSLNIAYNTWFTIIDNIVADYELPKGGGELYFWTTEYINNVTARLLSASGNQITKNVEIIANSKEWHLCKVSFDEKEFTADASHSIQLKKQSTTDQSAIFIIDDVRFQPTNSEASCYVYDMKTFKPVTFFDSQHFGLYYQYDNEGRLKRKIIETNRYGKRTVQEASNNIRKINK